MSETTRYNTQSDFPNSIDSLILMSDADINQIPLVQQHQSLIAQGRYTDAGIYIESNNLHSMCASLFNMLENRIYNVQNYIKNGKHTKWYDEYGVESPFAYGEEPSDKEATPVWIE